MNVPAEQHLSMSRGDSVMLAIPASEDLTDAVSVLFTAKTSRTLADASATFQKELGSGLTVNTTDISVATVPDDTDALPGKTILFWDAQAQFASGSPRTVARGTLTVWPDVSRELSPSVPMYTTEPDAVTNAAASAAAAAASAIEAADAVANAPQFRPEIEDADDHRAFETDGLSVPRVIFISTDDDMETWKLRAKGGGESDDGTSFRLPDDWHASTNNVIWVRIA